MSRWSYLCRTNEIFESLHKSYNNLYQGLAEPSSFPVAPNLVDIPDTFPSLWECILAVAGQLASAAAPFLRSASLRTLAADHSL